MRPSVALGKPREYADDPQGALHPQKGIDSPEGPFAQAFCGAIARNHRRLGRWRHIAARILQKRGEIIGRIGQNRILEIKQPHAGMTLPLRQPDQVFGMKVAQAYDRRQTAKPVAFRAYQCRYFGCGPAVRAAGIPQIPGKYLIDEPCQRRTIHGRKKSRRRAAVQRGQKIGCGGVKFAFMPRVLRRKTGKNSVAQIFDQQNPLHAIFCQNAGRCKSHSAQPPRHSRKCVDAFAFLGRSIHQHRAPAAQAQPFVTPCRGIPRKRSARRIRPPGLAQEIGNGMVSISHFHPACPRPASPERGSNAEPWHKTQLCECRFRDSAKYALSVRFSVPDRPAGQAIRSR